MILILFFRSSVTHTRNLLADIVPRPPRKANDGTPTSLRKRKGRRSKKKKSRKKSPLKTLIAESFKPYTFSVQYEDSRVLEDSLTPRSVSELRRRKKARDERDRLESIRQPNWFPVVQVFGSNKDSDGDMLREAATRLCDCIRMGNHSLAQSVRFAIDTWTCTCPYNLDTSLSNTTLCSLQLLESFPELCERLNDVVYFIANAMARNEHTHRRKEDGMSILMLAAVTENMTLCQELLKHGDELAGEMLAGLFLSLIVAITLLLSCRCFGMVCVLSSSSIR